MQRKIMRFAARGSDEALSIDRRQSIIRLHFCLTLRSLPVSTATITLSSKGQVVIPKEIRDELHWEAGTELTLIANASGVTLKAVEKKSGRNLADLIGMLKHDGPPLSTDALCKPVELNAEDGSDAS
ncbi:AbrB/MazE/SpoVT family DNA-binding domain-containing protein [Methylomonas koyamae]|uniref:AbrB/MazE/SpoVT family DNA-binding domain-containing protein n=1 Tax=Methylomonas koyamae TaxID=702114 RepID=UPI001C7EAAE5|nr:AbrB/MazE/SpoVT family DNA-binding domain-containing protein [Methylomonas koyamae]